MRREAKHLLIKIKVMLNKQKVQEFRSEFQKAVEQLEKDFGVAISLGTISFSNFELRGKMTARVGNAVPKATGNDFNVGEVVGIAHKKVSPNDEFKINKINGKTITVEKINVGGGRVGAQMRVSPSLLVKK
jgi:hypothetical protein|tara:strand:+ start:1935 stop:2327 length:393 start_codon:yes stop_codon:yes gene_type:complete